jgi:hypothetical protein
MTGMRDAEALLLRRYVIERTVGRVPAAEWARYEPTIGGWLYCDERSARTAQHRRRLRRPGALWCPVLGNRIEIAQDRALQADFETVDVDGWSRLAAAVRARPSDCLRRWREAGRRIIAAMAADPSGDRPPLGKLAAWPSRRGIGSRSLLSSEYQG